MQSNKTCPLVEQYLGYLVVIKGRSENTALDYRINLLMFFHFVLNTRNISFNDNNFCIVDQDFIKSITIDDMYAFIVYCQNTKKTSCRNKG